MIDPLAGEKALLRFYRRLSNEDQHALLRYAGFLSQSQCETVVEFSEVVPISPAKNETVIGALKRLSTTYPMLDKTNMLDQTSNLMSDHVLRGRNKEDVIREFELLFNEQYQKLKREHKSND